MTTTKMVPQAFATGVIRLHVPPTVREAELKAYLRGVGKAMKRAEGFVSRKIIEVPVDKGRLLLPLLKFVGATSEEAYANMKKWTQSDELAACLRAGANVGIQVEDQQYFRSSVGRVDLGIGGGKQQQRHLPPPKWKNATLVECWVFVAVVFNGLAGTGPALEDTFGDRPFSLLVLLVTVVPVLTYWALPLTLSVPVVSRWVHRRRRQRRTETPPPNGCAADVLQVLDDGFLMFAPDESLRRTLAKAERRLAKAERRLDLVEQRYKDLVQREDHHHHQNGGGGDVVISRRRRRRLLKEEEEEEASDVEAPAEVTEKDLEDDSDVEVESECDEGGVAVAVRHYVRWGLEKEFEEWCEDIADAMRDSGGFLGSDVFLEKDDDGDVDVSRAYVALFRFQTIKQLRTWETSEARARLVRQLQPLIEAPSAYGEVGAALRIVAKEPVIDPTARSERNFLGELLFAEHRGDHHKSESDDTSPKRTPALYKTAVLITLGLFLTMLCVSPLTPVLHRAMPHDLLGILVTTSLTVLGNTYFGAPLMTFFFGHWLTQNPSSHQSPNALAKYLVNGSQSRILNASLLLLYFAILVIAAIF